MKHIPVIMIRFIPVALKYPLKYEFNKNYGLNLWICTNEVEVCDFMTNDKNDRHDIYKCPKCKDGYMIVKHNSKNGEAFYGCSNFHNPDNPCNNQKPIPRKNGRT